jgi:flagellar hook protein FlgE
MMRSMFAAISGLKNHQTFMDVVGNNIANVNTTGFKQSRVTFQDILSQTVRGASGPQGGRGGVNPEQVGLGMLISGIDTIQTQGTLQSTGKLTDMAIQGDGYFVMSDGKQDMYSRDGAFDLGIDGTLVNPSNGLHVQGWMPDPLTGQINTAQPPRNISIPIGAGMTGKASSGVTVTGNLDANTAPTTATPPGQPYPLSTTIYDAQGNAVPVTLTFTKTGPNDWDCYASTTQAGVTINGATTPTRVGAMTFDGAGKLTSPNAATPFSISLAFGNTGTTVPLTPQTITMDLSQMTQLASAPSSLASNTDGASAGTLTSFSVGQGGDITGIYSNGYKAPLGQLAMASFANPDGLMKAGGNLFSSSANSGQPQVGLPDNSGRGTIATGFLEGSNVDLAQQFTNMIMAERGFQANSRVITTSDEILQDLVNIKD